jgi:hypothetical protein
MYSNDKFDLSGVFNIQKNYLTDLSNSYPNVNNASSIAKYVLDLQDKTKDIDSSYETANTSADAILTQQTDMIDIVSNEQKRLDDKKFLIDQAEESEQRKVLLTNSNKLRSAEYTKIILCAAAGLTIHVVLRLISKYFVGENSGAAHAAFIILHIVNILWWGIYMLQIYRSIQSRSQINFNKLELPPPHLTEISTSSPATANYNNLFKDLGLCYNENCCGENTIWDGSVDGCVPNANTDTEPFTISNETSQSPHACSSCTCNSPHTCSSCSTNASQSPHASLVINSDQLDVPVDTLVTLPFSNIEHAYKSSSRLLDLNIDNNLSNLNDSPSNQSLQQNNSHKISDIKYKILIG